MRLDPVAQAVRDQLSGPSGADPALAAAYAARRYQPIWIRGWGVRPDARAVLEALAEAPADGLDPDAYGAAGLPPILAAARSGRPADLARAEIALSAALAGDIADLHAPRSDAGMVYADVAVAPPRLDRTRVLGIVGRARSPAAAVAQLRRMNPLYETLRADLAAWRARGGAPATGRLLRANLERARALPAEFGPRYLLVDATAQTLTLYDHGQALDSMPVVVGKPSEPTPAMAGLVRYAVVRPYWNVPPDLVRNSIAPNVLRHGPGWFESQNMEALSDWSDEARILGPEEVDWAAVASGAQTLRVRQRPGPHNMMGQVKFVFPNTLGVYLHDSPLRQFFAEQRRTESAGCVRLSDAPRLARWLLADQASALGQPGAPETRIDLAQPIPVYIVYFTAMPSAGGFAVRPDIYRRDRPLEAELATATRHA
ncbi:MAG TPA: L,D-transpeptidase family protein [Phenylobacterium sp.]|nr:L,D-transpeptidase family protein [Phenylobacterium sp.]